MAGGTLSNNLRNHRGSVLILNELTVAGLAHECVTKVPPTPDAE